MATVTRFSMATAEGAKAKLFSEDVYYTTAKKTLKDFLDTIETSDNMNKAIKEAIDKLFEDSATSGDGRVKDVADSLAALESTVSTFLEGEDDSNGTLDRLKELVKAINDNKDSIGALVDDHLTKDDIVDGLASTSTEKALSANQGSVIAGRLGALEDDTHEHDNKGVLDALEEDASGYLKYNGVSLDGSTGIAIGATLAEATVYNGKIRLVISEHEVPTE